MTYDWQQRTYYKIHLMDGSELTTSDSRVLVKNLPTPSWVTFTDISGSFVMLNMRNVLYVKEISQTGKAGKDQKRS